MRPLAHPFAPVVGAALAALAYLLIQPATADMAAHAFRAWLFDTEGMTVWNAQWYGGHHVLGYSMLFAPLAAWPGPAWVGRARRRGRHRRVRAARARGGALAGRGDGRDVAVRRRRAQQRGDRPDAVHARHRARGGGVAVRRAARGRAGAPLAAVLALACVLASPVAGAFLALAAAARAAGGGREALGLRRDAGAAGGRRRRDDGGAVPGGRRRPLRGHRLLADAGGVGGRARRCWRPAGGRCGPARSSTSWCWSGRS